MTGKKTSGAPAEKSSNSTNTSGSLPKKGQERVSGTISTPSTSELKARFAPGSIPLTTDFSDLIDIAECGRRAIGQSADQTTNGVGAGLALSSNAATIGTLSVAQSNGITVSSSGVSVKPFNGITADSNGVSVKTYNGVSVDSNGVSVKPYNGIFVDSSGVSVKPHNGVSVDSNGVSVKPYNGVSVDSNGVSIKAGYGITVGSSGVSVDVSTLFPTGMIMMFSGETVPDGWLLCDGKDGTTPNLIDRFILGGKTADVGGKNTQKLSGDTGSRTFSATTTSATPTITTTVNDTKLDVSQIPGHTHEIKTKSSPKAGAVNVYMYENDCGDGNSTYPIGYDFDDGVNNPDYILQALSTGGGKGHDHSATSTQPAHSHDLNTNVPYYILAFIMKT
jgi:hypothetical protein